VPISQEPEAGKFNFEASSVKSFTVLDKPVFPTLPLHKMYQLQLVDVVLQQQGIGVFPTRPILLLVIIAGLAWAAWSYFSSGEEVVVVEKKQEVNPYQPFFNALKTAPPDQEVLAFTSQLGMFFQMPGWRIKDIKYIHGTINLNVLSTGGTMSTLYAWSKHNKINMSIRKTGVMLTKNISVAKRDMPKTISPISRIIATIVDRVAEVNPGNNLDIADTVNKKVFGSVLIKIKFASVAPVILNLIGEQLAGLPLTLNDITISSVDGNNNLTGFITVEALGN
jgi:hypothetical protein